LNYPPLRPEQEPVVLAWATQGAPAGRQSVDRRERWQRAAQSGGTGSRWSHAEPSFATVAGGALAVSRAVAAQPAGKVHRIDLRRVGPPPRSFMSSRRGRDGHRP